tara:strand:- start:1370 stop:2371 length:1002 start_codon:yes stop_codon:yes gene_type:complete
MLGTYTYNKILRKTVIGFGTLFNNIEVRKENADGTTYSKMKVPLAYGPRQKFLARLTEQPDLNQKAAITLPRLSFEMTGISYDATRKLSPITASLKAVDNSSIKKQFTPVPYNVDFEVNIISKTNDDALEIVEQILPVFQPSYNVTLKLVEEMNDFRDVPIVLNSISYTDDYEGSFDSRKLTLFTLQFTAKTYIFGPVGATGPIKKAKVDYHTNVNLDSTRQVAYEVTPKALTDQNQDGSTFLTSAITKTITTFEVDDINPISIGGYIEIGNEVMKVRKKPGGNKIQVYRAQNGTTAAAHASGAIVDLIDSADDALIDFGDDFGFNELTSVFE